MVRVAYVICNFASMWTNQLKSILISHMTTVFMGKRHSDSKMWWTCADKHISQKWKDQRFCANHMYINSINTNKYATILSKL